MQLFNFPGLKQLKRRVTSEMLLTTACESENEILITKRVSPGEMLLTTDFSCTRQTMEQGNLVFIGS
jgi:hypothetical protein